MTKDRRPTVTDPERLRLQDEASDAEHEFLRSLDAGEDPEAVELRAVPVPTRAHPHPVSLRPPTAWLVPRVSTRTTPEGFTETVTAYLGTDVEAVRLAAEKVVADLKAARAEPPKIHAAQLVAHHVLHREVLPDVVLQALAAAMSLNRRVEPRAWPGAGEAVEAARRSVGVVPVDRKYRAIVFDVVRWFSMRGDVLPGEVFQAVVVALGLTEHGKLRQWVVEQVIPSPAGEPRIGMRKPELFEAAVNFEVQNRLSQATDNEDEELDWLGDDVTRQETPPASLAKRIEEKLGTPVSANTMRAWVESPAYKMAVYVRLFWRSGLSRKTGWRRDDR